MVAKWDRATRSMMNGVHIIERIHARGALIKVLDKPHLDLTTPIGRGFMRPGRGRTPADREASQRGPSCCPEAWGAHGSQARVDRAATSRRSRANPQGRERQDYRSGVERGSHHRGTGGPIGRLMTGRWSVEAALSSAICQTCYRPPSPTSTKGAQTEECELSSSFASSINATITRRMASARVTMASASISGNHRYQ